MALVGKTVLDPTGLMPLSGIDTHFLVLKG